MGIGARGSDGGGEVVVVREIHQDGAQVPLVDDEQVITALSADRANEPLGSQILSGLKRECH